MRMKVRVMIVAALMLVGVGCGGSTSEAENPYGDTAAISNAHFAVDPLLIDFAGGATTGSLVENIYVNNLPTGKRVKSIWLKSVPGGYLTQSPVTVQPTFPAWMSVTWTIYATYAGIATFDCYLEMEDGSVSNSERVSVTIKQG